MPASNAQKRVKGKRIERPFIIGNEAWPIPAPGDPKRPPGLPDEFTKGWRVYLTTPEGQPDISTWLRKVSFKIFETYKNPTRVVEEPPFEVYEHGWGEFMIEIKLFFQPVVGVKPETRQHYLRVDPYGDEAQRQKQADEKMVRHEALDIIEFNEPTEALWEALTDPKQFESGTALVKPKGAGGRGKAVGRGGKAAAGVPPSGGGSVELPDSSTDTNPYSKDMEKQLIELLKKAEAEVKVQLDVTSKEVEEKRKQLQELKAVTTT